MWDCNYNIELGQLCIIDLVIIFKVSSVQRPRLLILFFWRMMSANLSTKMWYKVVIYMMCRILNKCSVHGPEGLAYSRALPCLSPVLHSANRRELKALKLSRLQFKTNSGDSNWDLDFWLTVPRWMLSQVGILPLQSHQILSKRPKAFAWRDAHKFPIPFLEEKIPFTAASTFSFKMSLNSAFLTEILWVFAANCASHQVHEMWVGWNTIHAE